MIFSKSGYVIKSGVWKSLRSSLENADKAIKPLRGDPWINGAFDDGKDFEEPANFYNGFSSFSPKFCISAIFKH